MRKILPGVAGAAVAGVALVLCAVRLGASDSGPGSDLRSFFAIRAVLNSESDWHRLESLSETMAFWRIAVQIVENPQGDGCLPINKTAKSSESMQLRFEFGSLGRRSSRIYAVEFSGCRSSKEDFDISFTRAGFSTDFDLAESPIAGDSRELRILKLALNEPEVFRELVDLQETQGVHYLYIRKQGYNAEGLASYSFVAAVTNPDQHKSPDSGSPEGSVLSYAVTYDVNTNTAEFHRVASEG